MDAIDEETVQGLDQLINVERDFKEALLIGEDILETLKDAPILLSKVSAHVWFRVALAARLTKKDPSRFEKLMRTAPDYSLIMEGDLRRDQALQAIRRHQFKEAEQLLRDVAQMHEGSENRYAALQMVRGRLDLAKGNLKSAASHFRAADDNWALLGKKADPQWVTNNLFHWLRCLVLLRDSDRFKVYTRFIVREPDTNRSQAASTMMLRGPLAAHGYGLLERIAS